MIVSAQLEEVFHLFSFRYFSHSAIVGGGGYGTAGLVGATNTFCEDNEPGGSAGTTYGAPDLYFLHLGSGGMYHSFYFPYLLLHSTVAHLSQEDQDIHIR